MSKLLEEEVRDLSAVVLSHTALLTSMWGVLKSRGLLDQAAINEIVDLALVGIENAQAAQPEVFEVARQVLEMNARNMGGEVGA